MALTMIIKQLLNMTLDEYQKIALSTAIYPESMAIIYPALGLAGETGEVAEKIKKTIRDNKGVFDDTRKTEIAKELGDVMWYAANLAADLGISLDEIAAINVEKIKSRQNRSSIHGNGDNR